MSKRQLIDDIRRYNTNVQPQFLAQFEETALREYLEHLQGAFSKRIHISSWAQRKPRMRVVMA